MDTFLHKRGIFRQLFRLSRFLKAAWNEPDEHKFFEPLADHAELNEIFLEIFMFYLCAVARKQNLFHQLLLNVSEFQYVNHSSRMQRKSIYISIIKSSISCP